MSSSSSSCSRPSIRACWSLASPNHLKSLSFDLLTTACIEHEGASLRKAIWHLCCAPKSHIAIHDFLHLHAAMHEGVFHILLSSTWFPDEGFPDEEDARGGRFGLQCREA